MALELTQRFKRAVDPLSITTSIEVMGGADQSPALQTVKGSSYTPDRTSYPTVIKASAVITSKDGSANWEMASSQITNLQWWVQAMGEDSATKIESHSKWSTSDYLIDNSNAKGKLTVKKNVPTTEKWTVFLTFDIADTRRGYTETTHVQTDTILLYSIEEAETVYSMSIDRPNSEVYEPLLDRSLIHAYKVSRGEESSYSDDGEGHLREMHVTLSADGEKLTAGTDYEIKIYRKESDGTESEATTANDDCLKSIDGGTIKFDVLFSDDRTYRIVCIVDGTEVAFLVYGWAWSPIMPSPSDGVVTGATYGDAGTQAAKLGLTMGGSRLERPEVGLVCDWYSRVGSSDTFRGSGETHVYDTTDSTMFATGSTEGEAVVKMSKRQPAKYMTDESGNRVTDADGNYLLFF